MFNRILLISIFLLTSSTSFLLAQESSMLDTVYSIREVEVVAKPFQEIIPSQRLSGKKLQQLNSHSVADALRYFSGVQLKDYGGMGGLKTINVRNMGSQHVGVFYDGVQLGNAQNGVVDLGRYSLDDMEEIAMYNGQKSEIFQAAKDYSSASSIYLRTKRPRFSEGKNTNLLVRYKAGSIHLINPSFRLEQRLNKRFSASLSGEYTKSGGEYKFRYKRKNIDGTPGYDTTAYRKNSDIEAYRIEGGVFGVVGGGFLETKLYYYNSDRGLPGPIVSNVFEWGDRMKDKNFFVQSTYTKEFNHRYKLKGQAKFAFDYTQHLPSEDKYYQQEAYISAINMYSVTPWWDVALSTDFQWNKLNASKGRQGLDFAYPTRNSTYISLSNALDFNQFKAQASILTSLVQDDVKSGINISNKSEFTPALFLGYQPFAKHDFNIRAFYKRIFRMPTFNELYYGTDLETNIKPEYTNQYNIGFSYNKQIKNELVKAITLQVDAYYLNVTDKIIATPGSNGLRWTVSNTGKVQSKGVDAKVGIEAKVNKVGINATMTYSYSEAINKSAVMTSSYGDQIPYTPWHSATAILNANYETWNFNYSYIYVGKRYSAENNIARNEMRPWHTHDLSVQKTFGWKQYKVKGSVEMNNAFNQYYDVVINYPMPGRSFKFVINLEI